MSGTHPLASGAKGFGRGNEAPLMGDEALKRDVTVAPSEAPRV